MYFIKTEQASVGEVDLVNQLSRALLANEPVLWLISGGSNIPLTAAIIKRLDNVPKDNLTTMLMDERYGTVGHQDSNAYQLQAVGVDLDEINFIPVLKNESVDKTTVDFAAAYTEALADSTKVIGQFGIGSDGHTAGILPNSTAASSKDIAAHYTASDFTRITLTPQALLNVTDAYVFAWGEAKKTPLQELRDMDLAIERQPAQLLKKIPNVYVYNDQIGE